MTMFKLREHQSAALKSIKKMKSDRGRIVIPTGGGKTAVQAYALRDAINSTDDTQLHVVFAPRIVLANQLIKEYRDLIGQNYIALAFHSGGHEPDPAKVRWAEQATTKVELVKTELARAKKLGKDLVVFSTYASSEKLTEFNFDTITADESQYCVAENHFETIRSLKADRKLFFTATEKHTSSSNGRGLNNEVVFGPVVYQTVPKTLISKGYIVAPRLHVMAADKNHDTDTVVDEVLHLGKKQADLSKQTPVNKILFAMKGTDDVTKVVDNLDRIKKEMPGYTVFTILSNAKYGSMVDGKKQARGNFFKVLRETDKALIFHYDILSEGIDIDGITGVVLMRNMGHAKLLQTIGRAVRTYKADPSKKTQAWVSVMVINGNEESAHHLKTVVNSIRDGGFDVNVEQVEFTDSDGYGIASDEDLEDVVEPETATRAKSLLNNVIHDIEDDKYWQELHSSTEEQILEEF